MIFKDPVRVAEQANSKPSTSPLNKPTCYSVLGSDRVFFCENHIRNEHKQHFGQIAGF